MKMNKKTLIYEILTLTIIGLVFISGCVQQESNGTNGQDGDEGIIPADLTQITFFTEEEGRAVDPDWSPDGTQIVF